MNPQGCNFPNFPSPSSASYGFIYIYKYKKKKNNRGALWEEVVTRLNGVSGKIKLSELTGACSSGFVRGCEKH